MLQFDIYFAAYQQQSRSAFALKLHLYTIMKVKQCFKGLVLLILISSGSKLIFTNLRTEISYLSQLKSSQILAH